MAGTDDGRIANKTWFFVGVSREEGQRKAAKPARPAAIATTTTGRIIGTFSQPAAGRGTIDFVRARFLAGIGGRASLVIQNATVRGSLRGNLEGG